MSLALYQVVNNKVPIVLPLLLKLLKDFNKFISQRKMFCSGDKGGMGEGRRRFGRDMVNRHVVFEFVCA